MYAFRVSDAKWKEIFHFKLKERRFKKEKTKDSREGLQLRKTKTPNCVTRMNRINVLVKISFDIFSILGYKMAFMSSLVYADVYDLKNITLKGKHRQLTQFSVN